MRGEDIDLVLARDDNIVPSSGFTASVMDAVTRDATTPPPIPFPWKRALPGLTWCLAVNIGFLVSSLRSSHTASPAPDVAVLSTVLAGAAWIAAALVVSLASVALSTRIARRV
jgi:hypothetical protein